VWISQPLDCACIALPKEHYSAIDATARCSCENFIGLCNKHAPNSYINSIFHRVVAGAWIQVGHVRTLQPQELLAESWLCCTLPLDLCLPFQGGDVASSNGDGGASIYGAERRGPSPCAAPQ
jgi:hypothetical protein